MVFSTSLPSTISGHNFSKHGMPGEALSVAVALQLDTYERVKEKVSTTSVPFSLARQRLQRANSGINSRPASDSRPEASTPSNQADAATPEMKSPFQNAPRATSATSEPVRVHRMLVASPAVDLTPPKQTPSGTPNMPPSRAQPPRPGGSVKAPASPPPTHPAVSSKPPARQGSDQLRGGGGLPPSGETGHGAPDTPERMASGRMHSGRIPPGLATQEGEPGSNLKPIQTARSSSLSRGMSLLFFSPPGLGFLAPPYVLSLSG